jgi:hypothetical protein
VITIEREREVLSEEPSSIVRSSAGCEGQPCSWVHREGRDREKKREDLMAKSIDQNWMLSS